MKRILLFLCILVSGLFSSAQTYWPHGSRPYPKCNTMPTNCTIYAVQDGDWRSNSTWSLGRPPLQDEVVCIPAGRTVDLSGIYDYSDRRLQIFVCGTLDFNFNAPGKLSLAAWSFIQVYSGGTILSRNGDAELINIGGVDVWRRNNETINGPWVLSHPYVGAGVLTVNFDYLRASQKQPYTVQLDWGTNYESNTASFLVERSTNQKNWESIGTVAAKGNSSQKETYTFTDNNPLHGIAYYRLKEVNMKGEGIFSEIVRYNFAVTKKLSIFPNPLSSSTRIYSKEPFKAGQVLQITNGTGSRIKTINAAAGNSVQLDLSSYSPGLYLVQLIENGKVIENLQIIKQ